MASLNYWADFEKKLKSKEILNKTKEEAASPLFSTVETYKHVAPVIKSKVSDLLTGVFYSKIKLVVWNNW